jgi:hypothetical protein
MTHEHRRAQTQTHPDPERLNSHKTLTYARTHTEHILKQYTTNMHRNAQSPTNIHKHAQIIKLNISAHTHAQMYIVMNTHNNTFTLMHITFVAFGKAFPWSKNCSDCRDSPIYRCAGADLQFQWRQVNTHILTHSHTHLHTHLSQRSHSKTLSQKHTLTHTTLTQSHTHTLSHNKRKTHKSHNIYRRDTLHKIN